MCTLTTIKDIFGIIIPIFTLIIALIGLTTWRKKLWGENKFTLAMDFLRELYLLKEEIRVYRNAFYSAGEIYQAFKKMTESNPEEKYDQNKATIFAENIRWNKVIEQYEKYKHSLIRLKIIINNYNVDYVEKTEMTKFLKEINSMRIIKEMQKKRPNYLPFMTEQQRKEYLEQEEKIMKILNYIGDDDEFDKKIEEYFNKINKRIRKYLN